MISMDGTNEAHEKLAKLLSECLEETIRSRLLSGEVREALRAHRTVESMETPEETRFLNKATLEAYESGDALPVVDGGKEVGAVERKLCLLGIRPNLAADAG